MKNKTPSSGSKSPPSKRSTTATPVVKKSNLTPAELARRKSLRKDLVDNMNEATRAEISTDALGLMIKATAFAAEKHRDQRRKDAGATPYINHPIALVNVLRNESGVEDISVLCAAVLHDTIEDTQTSAKELRREFGAEIAKIVVEVTDDKTLPKATRKQLQIQYAPALSYQAKLVKLADKICNLRDMSVSPPRDWPATRLKEYYCWAKAVVDAIGPTHTQLDVLFEAEFIKHFNSPCGVMRPFNQEEFSRGFRKELKRRNELPPEPGPTLVLNSD